MYKYLAILLPVMLSPYNRKQQEKAPAKIIGIGLLTANTQYPVLLYKTETDKVPFDVLKFEVEKSGVTKFISNISLKPYALSKGDSNKDGEEHIRKGLIHFPPVLRFRVADTTASFFKVITNEETLETFIIKRDNKNAFYTSEQQLFDNSCSNCPNTKYNPRWYIFETWERYLKRAEMITKKNIKIYDVPDGKVIFENKDNVFLPFTVIEVKGEWIKLKKGVGREFNFDNTINYSGWTKWREGQNKVIDVIEHTYE